MCFQTGMVLFLHWAIILLNITISRKRHVTGDNSTDNGREFG